MGFFDKFFKKKQNNKPLEAETFVIHPEASSLHELKKYMDEKLVFCGYVSKKEYKPFIESKVKTIEFFSTLINSGLLDTYCEKNRLSSGTVRDIMARYENFEKAMDVHNEEYMLRAMLDEKSYLDSILKSVDPKINLDEDQRKVVLTDEDYCLVIAGAGAGKTTTVAAKVKYLVEKKGVDPSQILVVSFTNKAVQELREKVNRDLGIDCPITTFHSTGHAIIRKQSDEKLNIVDSSKLYFVLQDYFKRSILTNESLVNNLILFFASYFDAPYEGTDLNTFFNNIAKSNFATMRSDLNEFKQQVIDIRTGKSVTIQNEVLRSRQEVEIANYLYLNNIEYEYEPIYKYDILCAKKPYTPDFIIRQGDLVAYIEHFGITEDGKNNRFSEDALNAYKKAINDKVQLHRQHGTKLIYTFSSYRDGRSLIDHLKEELENQGFVLTPRSNKEIMEKIVSSEENRYIRKLLDLICRFITNFKANGFAVEDFDRMYHATQNVRTRLFINVCQDCYLEYERYLKENGAIDFQDMINESARLLREVKEMKQKLDFKYVIVDEYQDISKQRFDLVTALSDVTNAKIIAVGDDWQSIYAFSGSDIELFLDFEKKMGYAKLLKIENTYRNAQEVIDIAGNFILQNKRQLEKELKSPKHIDDPVIIYTYDSTRKKQNADNKSGANYSMARALEIVVEQIMEYNKRDGKSNKSPLLFLGRFGFEPDQLQNSGLFEYDKFNHKIKSVKYPFLNIEFMTVHKSKGLGYENVIIMNGKNETYGFPAKIENDPVLSFVTKQDNSIDYAEERRLFYVAMTRTKNRVFFIAPEQNPSEFLLEIKRDFKNVVLRGDWKEESVSVGIAKKSCPICGYPLQFRYKNGYGLRLHICTNDPEVCGFMTNEYGAGKLSIMKCDQCRDGYLIVKPGRDNNFFLGCTNYKKDGTGCGKVIWKQQYYEMLGLTPDSVEHREVPKIELESTVRPVYQPETKENARTEIERANVKTVLYKGLDLNYVIHTILQCLSDLSEKRYYGVTVLVDVLRGSKNQRIKDADLNATKNYGALSNVSREDLEIIIEWLIEKHFILKTKGMYPVLHPTYDGTHYSEKITKQGLNKLLQLLERE